MQGEILEEFMGAIPIYPRGKEKGRALERDHQRGLNPSSPMSMRDSACPCKQPPLYGASWWSYNWLNTPKELAFSVVQGAGKGCPIGQDRLVGLNIIKIVQLLKLWRTYLMDNIIE